MDDPKEKLKAWLSDTLSALSNNNVVSVEYSTDDRGVLFTAVVSSEGMGLILGRGGSTVISVRNILHALGRKNNMTASLKIEPQE